MIIQINDKFSLKPTTLFDAVCKTFLAQVPITNLQATLEREWGRHIEAKILDILEPKKIPLTVLTPIYSPAFPNKNDMILLII